MNDLTTENLSIEYISKIGEENQEKANRFTQKLLNNSYSDSSGDLIEINDKLSTLLKDINFHVGLQQKRGLFNLFKKETSIIEQLISSQRNLAQTERIKIQIEFIKKDYMKKLEKIDTLIDDLKKTKEILEVDQKTLLSIEETETILIDQVFTSNNQMKEQLLRDRINSVELSINLLISQLFQLKDSELFLVNFINKITDIIETLDLIIIYSKNSIKYLKLINDNMKDELIKAELDKARINLEKRIEK